jgi:thiol-disulfide isomerase/thioredoxin
VVEDAVRLGPLLLPFALLVLMGALSATLLVGHGLAKRAGVDVESALWLAVLAGVVAARLAFVYEYRTLYWANPLRVLDIRDGGWNPAVGLAAAWAYALYRQRRQPTLGRPLRWALVAGSVLFIGGSGLLAMRGGMGAKLPDLALHSLQGEPVRLAGFEGRPVVVNLWATWCPPCVREMPVLQRAQAARPDVHVVFLNQGEPPAEVQRWLEQRGLGTLRNVLVDELRQASASFKSYGYPTTLFFDARGRLVARRIGELSDATLQEHLRKASP